MSRARRSRPGLRAAPPASRRSKLLVQGLAELDVGLHRAADLDSDHAALSGFAKDARDLVARDAVEVADSLLGHPVDVVLLADHGGSYEFVRPHRGWHRRLPIRYRCSVR